MSRNETATDLTHPTGTFRRCDPDVLTITQRIGSVGIMKTTLDIHDELLTRAKQHAQETRRPLRAVVEEGLRLVLSKETRSERYVLPDRSYGGPGTHDPLASYTWPELRDIIYGDDSLT